MFIILWLNDLIRWPYRYLLRTATWLLNMIESLFQICSSWQWMRIEVWNPIKVLCVSLKCNRKNSKYSISDMNIINPRIILFPVNWKSAMLLDYRANSRQQEIRHFTFYRTDLLFRTKNLSPSSRKTELHMTYSFLHIFCYDCP